MQAYYADYGASQADGIKTPAENTNSEKTLTKHLNFYAFVPPDNQLK